MLPCMPCLKLRSRCANVSGLTRGMSDVSLRTAKKKKGEEKEEEDYEMLREWVAEDEQGVFITFVSLPHGGNHLKKLRFSEKYFDKWRAKRWWYDNCERIMSLYSAEYPTPTPCQSGNWYTGECSYSNSKGQSTELVVEDYPGVYLNILQLGGGGKELIRIQFSREKFGEVKARVWWEDNKARLNKLYPNTGNSEREAVLLIIL